MVFIWPGIPHLAGFLESSACSHPYQRTSPQVRRRLSIISVIDDSGPVDQFPILLFCVVFERVYWSAGGAGSCNQFAPTGHGRLDTEIYGGGPCRHRTILDTGILPNSLVNARSPSHSRSALRVHRPHLQASKIALREIELRSQCACRTLSFPRLQEFACASSDRFFRSVCDRL